MERSPRVGGALVPCTCGELVQGSLEGMPFLVSCPIDRYSVARVTLDVDAPAGAVEAPPKALSAARAALRALGAEGTPFTLEVSCPLSPSKGFGTSTADVVGAIAATAMALGTSLSPEEIAKLAVSLEPSDGTMFPGLALLDHRTARRWELLAPAPPLLVVVLEFEGTVDTLDFNAQLDRARLRAFEDAYARILDLLCLGLRRQRLELVGRAATLSSQINQQFLLKPELERVIALGREHHALGVCAAHSGTALGVLFAPEQQDDALRLQVQAARAVAGLERVWLSRLVDGGAREVSHHQGLRLARRHLYGTDRTVEARDGFLDDRLLEPAL